MPDAPDLATLMRDVLAALIRSGLTMDERQQAAERREALRLHEAMLAEADPQRLAALRIDGLWAAAIKQAETPELQQQPLRVSMQFPTACPVTLDELVAPTFSPAVIEARIRASASTG